MSYNKELTAAKKAVSLAASLCQKVQKALMQSDVQSKPDKSPVTVADYGSQALISFVLQKELPSESFSLVAEEDAEDLRKDGAKETLERVTRLVNDTLSSNEMYCDSVLSTEDVVKAIDCGKSEGGSHGKHWILDPIDGTKGFLRGDQYAIALALLDEGKLVLGMLACPNLPLNSHDVTSQDFSNHEIGCLFFAELGAGTYMQSLDPSSTVKDILGVKKVKVSAVDNPEEASFLESYEVTQPMHEIIAKNLGVRAPPIRIDSQAKYGALSRGDGSIYMRLFLKGHCEKIWDQAAGSIITTEAGGVVVDAAGKPLDFSRGRYLDVDAGVFATNKILMPSLLKAVRESMEKHGSLL